MTEFANITPDGVVMRKFLEVARKIEQYYNVESGLRIRNSNDVVF
jgi:hypothetical protein